MSFSRKSAFHNARGCAMAISPLLRGLQPFMAGLRHFVALALLLFALVPALFVTLGFGGAARAEHDTSAFEFWEQQAQKHVRPFFGFLPGSLLPTRKPMPSPIDGARQQESGQRMRQRLLLRDVPDGLDKTVRVVAVFGDALGDALARGLSENFSNRGDVLVVAKTNANMRLLQPEPQTSANADVNAAVAHDPGVGDINRLIGARQQMSVAVLALGLRDLGLDRRMSAGAGYPPGYAPTYTPGYSLGTAHFSDSEQTQLKARVHQIAAAFRAAKIPLIWVGLPQGLDDALATRIANYNALLEEQLSLEGVAFIDARALFANDAQRVDVFGTGIDGRRARLWRDDRMTLTLAGERKYALLLEHDVTLAMAGAPESEFAAVPPEIGATGDVNRLIENEHGAQKQEDTPSAAPERVAAPLTISSEDKGQPPEDVISLPPVLTAPQALTHPQSLETTLLHPIFLKANSSSLITPQDAEALTQLFGSDHTLEPKLRAILCTGKPLAPRKGRLDSISLRLAP